METEFIKLSTVYYTVSSLHNTIINQIHNLLQSLLTTNTPKISIIIPIHNSEKWINKCLSSILKQSYYNFEVLMIDDDSTDASANICQEYNTIDNRFKYYHVNFCNVSKTRNFGLELVSGEYVVFIDSDDYVNENYIEHLISSIGNSELVIGGLIQESEQQELLSTIKFTCEKTDLHQNLAPFKTIHILAHGFPVAKLFMTKIINNNRLRFCETINFSEDLVFLLDYCRYINTISTISDVDYHYVQHPKSLSRRINDYDQEFVNCQTILTAVESYTNAKKIDVNEIISIENHLPFVLIGRLCLAISNGGHKDRHKFGTLYNLKIEGQSILKLGKKYNLKLKSLDVILSMKCFSLVRLLYLMNKQLR